MLSKDSVTASHAVDFKLPPQGELEGDSAFQHRVAGALRDMGKIIEAHEAQQNSRFDAGGDAGGRVMDGLLGAAALALGGQSERWASRGASKVGDEVVAGLMVRHGPTRQEKEAADAALIQMFDLTGGRF